MTLKRQDQADGSSATFWIYSLDGANSAGRVQIFLSFTGIQYESEKNEGGSSSHEVKKRNHLLPTWHFFIFPLLFSSLSLFAAQISHRLFVSPGRDGENRVSICLSLSLSLWDLGLSPPVRCPSPPPVSVQLSNEILSGLQKAEMGNKWRTSIGPLEMSCF